MVHWLAHWLTKICHVLLLKPGFYTIVPIAQIVSKYFEAIPAIDTVEAIFGFHIIASIALKSDTACFGPAETGNVVFAGVLKQSVKSQGNLLFVLLFSVNKDLSVCLTGMGLHGNLAAYRTVHWCKSFLSTLSCLLPPFWNACFGTQCRKSNESWNNWRSLEYIWNASIVHVMREWFPFKVSV